MCVLIIKTQVVFQRAFSVEDDVGHSRRSHGGTPVRASLGGGIQRAVCIVKFECSQIATSVSVLVPVGSTEMFLAHNRRRFVQGTGAVPQIRVCTCAVCGVFIALLWFYCPLQGFQIHFVQTQVYDNRFQGLHTRRAGVEILLYWKINCIH